MSLRRRVMETRSPDDSALRDFLLSVVNGTITGAVVGDFPEITTLRSCLFRLDASITSVYFPFVTNIKSSVFDQCSSIVSARFPNLVSFTSLGSMSNLRVLDIGSANVDSNAFDAGRLENLILRKTNGVQSITPSTMNATPAKSGGAGITVYIPQAMYDHLQDGSSLDYYKNTYWKQFIDYGTITFAVLEGSEYE